MGFAQCSSRLYVLRVVQPVTIGPTGSLKGSGRIASVPLPSSRPRARTTQDAHRVESGDNLVWALQGTLRSKQDPELSPLERRALLVTRATVLLASMVPALLVGCGSSSDHKADAASDGGGQGDAFVSNDVGETCNPLGVPGCPHGKTCCLPTLRGVCQDPGACTSGLQFECSNNQQCGAGNVCCAAIPLTLDVSLIPLDGGPWQLPMGVTVRSFCTSDCSAPNLLPCYSSADCTGGSVCTPLPEGIPILLVLGAETLTACLLPDGGPPSSEEGASEGGSPDGRVSDARAD
jgi:hypothetical protein